MNRQNVHRMFESSTTPQTSEVECLSVQAMLQSGQEVEISEAEGEQIARHVEHCDECAAFLDLVCPESPPSASGLIERLEHEIASRLREGTEPASAVRPTVLAALAQPTPSTDHDDQMATEGLPASLVAQLPPGYPLSGTSSEYVIRRFIHASEFTETYEADWVADDGADHAESAIIKIPRVAAEMSDDEAMKRLRVLKTLIDVNTDDLKNPWPMQEVARVLDRGLYTHRLRTCTTESTFVAYEHVPGCDLATYMEQRHRATHEERFTGLKTSAEFARWARMLTKGLREIHSRLIIHGDISPRSILVSDDRPVFVDVGKNLFTEVLRGVGEFNEHFYRAPEGVATPGSDLFSLGAVLYFLATGKKPIGLASYTDKEELKVQLAAKIKNHNPALYQNDAGVVDVIAMCLRKTGRVQHADHLLRDIDTFWPEDPPTSILAVLDSVKEHAAVLDQKETSLFRSIAVVQARALDRVIKDMNNGVFDISGSSNDIRSAAFSLIGALGDGDEFFGLSLPVFWAPENIGINGRFLSMTRNAAARGARVKRVFLLQEGFKDRHLRPIVAAQLNAVADLDPSMRANYGVRFVVMSAETRRQLVASGKHFGLLVKDRDQISMSPVYGSNDLLVTLRFRAGARPAAGLRETFDRIWSYARPLVDLKLPPNVAVSDTAEPLAV
jgi:serine/threonine protein kinase